MVFAAVSAFVVTNYDNFVPMSVLAKAMNRNSFGMAAVELFAARTIAPVTAIQPGRCLIFQFIQPGDIIVNSVIVSHL